ncbi:MAG TPA: transporter substrate-binding domain-containing protein [Clostridiaceae bacterium]|nr:transporter substrate-binding domain-containing protein [Clostridiaceae bacterium]
MKKSKTMILAVITILIMALGIAACGNSDDKPSEEAGVKLIEISLTEEDYAFGVAKDQPELSKAVNEFISEIQGNGTLDEIFEKYFGGGTPVAVKSAELDPGKDQLVVATNASFEPFEYMLGEDYYGIDMEIAALMADHLDKELVISNMDFDAVCLSVGQGKADIAMAGLTVTESRKEFVEFSDSYYAASQNIIVIADDTTFDECKDSSEVETILSELGEDTKIGVQNGTTGQFYVEGDDDWGFVGFDVTCVGYNAGSLAVQDMLNGNINYVIIDEAPAQFIVTSVNELN